MDYFKQEALFSSLENRKCLQRSETFLVAAPIMQGLCPQPAAADNLEAEPPQPPALRVCDPRCHSCIRCPAQHIGWSGEGEVALGFRNATQSTRQASWLHTNQTLV